MDPTKKELYTARRSSGVDLNNPEIKTLIEQLKSSDNPTNWILFKVQSTLAVVPHSCGESGIEEMISTLTEDDVYYGAFQCLVNNSVKFFHIYFVGVSVPPMKKGKSSLFKSAILGQIQAHGEISCVNGLLEFTKSFIVEGICKQMKLKPEDVVL